MFNLPDLSSSLMIPVASSFILGALLAGLIRALFKIGLMIGLIVGVLVVSGVITLGATGTGNFNLQAMYGLATSVWTFLGGYAADLMKVFESGGVYSGLAGIVGFGLSWVGVGFIPLRRRD
jgi:hypothetical protein